MVLQDSWLGLPLYWQEQSVDWAVAKQELRERRK
jgi:hypothetical protein